MDRTAVAVVATRRRMIELRVEGRMRAPAIAEMFGISVKTFYKWKRRFRQEGDTGLSNRNSRPLHSPRRASNELETQVIAARKAEPKSPAYLAQLPSLKDEVSAHGIHCILVRHGFNRLSMNSGVRPVRYEREKPWEMVHIDVKYLPAIEGQKGREYEFTAIDDRTREVYAAIYPSKTTKHAVDFLNRACRILDVTHKRTRPHRPRTNGKVERFHRTVDVECYHVRRFTSSEEWKKALAEFLVYYNERRMHGALGFKTPGAICIALGGRKQV